MKARMTRLHSDILLSVIIRICYHQVTVSPYHLICCYREECKRRSHALRSSA
jgi:hypothetical protein